MKATPPLPSSPNFPSSAAMGNNTIPPNSHHAPNDSSTSNPLSDLHPTNRIEGPPSEADPSCGPTHPTPDIRCSSQDSHPSNLSADWEINGPWAPGYNSPSYQETFEGSNNFNAALVIHTSYPDTYFQDGSPHSVHELDHPDTSQPALLCPLGRTDNSSLGVPEETERKPTSEMTYMNRSPLMPLIAMDRSSLPAWSGPIHVPVHGNHCSLGLASDPLSYSPLPRLAEDAQQYARTTPESWSPDVSPTVVHQTSPAKVPLLLLPMPINWREIPQQQYTSRTGDVAFWQLKRITFSVNRAPGFNMQRALDRVFTGLDGRDDPVLENANGPASCRLLFPGYPINTHSSQIPVRDWKKDPAPITKSKLSYEVAKRVRKYLDVLTVTPINLSADPQWTVGQGWMKFEKMYLVSISWVSKGSLQPEIWVDTGLDA